MSDGRKQVAIFKALVDRGYVLAGRIGSPVDALGYAVAKAMSIGTKYGVTFDQLTRAMAPAIVQTEEGNADNTRNAGTSLQDHDGNYLPGG